MFCTFDPNLVILWWTSGELSRGQARDWHTHTRTHEHTDTQKQTTTIPEGQNWPRVKIKSLFDSYISIYHNIYSWICLYILAYKNILRCRQLLRAMNWWAIVVSALLGPFSIYVLTSFAEWKRCSGKDVRLASALFSVFWKKQHAILIGSWGTNYFNRRVCM